LIFFASGDLIGVYFTSPDGGLRPSFWPRTGVATAAFPQIYVASIYIWNNDKKNAKKNIKLAELEPISPAGWGKQKPDYKPCRIMMYIIFI
jgi:hypothetical protein